MTVVVTNQDPRTHEIIGAAIEVHNTLGHGFLEAVYQEAFAIELEARGIPFQREIELQKKYKERSLKCTYKADFLFYGEVVVELKALSAIGGPEQAQVIDYLKATGLRLGLLLNFGSFRLEIKRMVFDPQMTQMNTDRIKDETETA